MATNMGYLSAATDKIADKPYRFIGLSLPQAQKCQWNGKEKFQKMLILAFEVILQPQSLAHIIFIAIFFVFFAYCTVDIASRRDWFPQRIKLDFLPNAVKNYVLSFSHKNIV